ncbi:MAG: ATP synthase F1 subunit delta [Flammeovirgaceae bacterium]|jgi:F-type H+-transporting ATPase subunit delta|nr:ATP synthase F1 subunit delta [Flammeovirgaceae bacterium]
MADVRVASRYVKSLLGLAVERGLLEQVHEDMQVLERVFANSRDLVNMLRSPIIRHEKKRAILEKVFKGNINSLSFDIIDILTRKNRERLLPAIATEFHVAYNEYMGIGKATITTTVPMDATLKAEIEAIVKQLSHRTEIELEEKVDKNLIGGFVLNVEDKRIDASIKSKLKNLKLKFSHNPYLKEF